MSKSTKERAKKQKVSTFSILNPNAGAVDIADKEIVVCVPPDRDEETIRTFGTFTCDLHAIAAFLVQCRVDTLAMESTGVYWVALYLILKDYGIDVYLVNAKHVKNVTGRKDDDEDAAWLQRLHSCGLLNRSFQPENDERTLRTLVRHRNNLMESQSVHVNRMIKSMELMNIKLQTVISDILGKSGMSILHAIIVEKVRDAEKLSELTNPRIKATKETIIKSLTADWRSEHLFELEQNYELYKEYQKKIVQTEQKIEEQLQQQLSYVKQEEECKKVQKNAQKTTKKLRKNEYYFNAGMYIENLTGVNPTEIYGISDTSAMRILAEVGKDMSKFKNAKHFCSWLGLAPNTKITGGKVISSKIPKKKQYAAQAFRMAANSLWHSQNELGDFYRRIKSKSGAAKAVVATAKKLATIYYEMMSKKEKFNPEQLKEYQEIYKQKKIQRIEKQLEKLKVA